MPIIPRYESIQGDIPTPKVVTPDVSLFPAAAGAALGAGLAKAADEFSAAAVKRSAIQGYLKAETLKSELAVRLDKAMEDVKSSPQKTIEGIALTSGDPGGLDEPVATTSVVPRSQTIEADYKKAEQAIVDDVTKKAGNSPFVMRHLQPAVERLRKGGEIAAQRQALTYWHQENHATVLENAEILARTLGSTPAIPAAKDEQGNLVIDTADDKSYATLRQGVADTFDNAVRAGGMPADMAEKSKLTRLAKLDHGRAVQTMNLDPSGWVEASVHGRNGWADRLTPEAMAKLDDKAEKILKKQEGSSTQQRLDDQREWEQDAFLKLRKRELTVPDIEDAVKRRVIDSEHADAWVKKVNAVATGHWDSDGPTVLKYTEMAHDPKVDKNQFYAQTANLLKPGGLNLDDFNKLNGIAAGVHDHRVDVKFREGNQAYANVHSVISTTLATPQSFMGTNHEQATQLIRSNAQTEFSEHVFKNNYDPAAQMKWEKDRLPYYARQMTGYAKTQIQVQNRLLGGLQMQTDPKTGFIENDEIKKARSNAFQKAGVDPAQTEALVKRGIFPEALKAQLQRIQDIKNLTDYQRSLPQADN